MKAAQLLMLLGILLTLTPLAWVSVALWLAATGVALVALGALKAVRL